jgi:hypothetical protein
VKIHISASSGRTRGRLKVKNGEIFAFSLRALGTVHPLLLVTELFGPRIARRIVGDALAHHQPLHQPFRRSFHLPRPRAKRQAPSRGIILVRSKAPADAWMGLGTLVTYLDASTTRRGGSLMPARLALAK